MRSPECTLSTHERPRSHSAHTSGRGHTQHTRAAAVTLSTHERLQSHLVNTSGGVGRVGRRQPRPSCGHP